MIDGIKSTNFAAKLCGSRGFPINNNHAKSCADWHSDRILSTMCEIDKFVSNADATSCATDDLSISFATKMCKNNKFFENLCKWRTSSSRKFSSSAKCRRFRVRFLSINCPTTNCAIWRCPVDKSATNWAADGRRYPARNLQQNCANCQIET